MNRILSVCVILGHLFLMPLYAEISSFTEAIGVYFPLTYQKNPNKVHWSQSGYTGSGDRHSLTAVGLGLRYFPIENFFLDYSQKKLISQQKIGDIVDSNYLYNADIESMDTYSFTLNYFIFRNAKNLGIYIGGGRNINSVIFLPFGRNASGSSIATHFYTMTLRTGIEYKFSKRGVISLTIGYESPFSFSHIDYANRLFKYDYKSGVYFEPALILYF